MLFSSQAVCLRLFAFSRTKRPQRDLQVFFSLFLSCMLTLRNKTGSGIAWAPPNKARPSHRPLQGLQLMQRGRGHPEPWAVAGKHMLSPDRLWENCLGSCRKQLLCWHSLRRHILADDDYRALPASMAAASMAS